ncbi:hypothetical protein E2C01_013708 [Portunus trituberculatus]|uniref:Uncharacterized protein n=1 Tax=Portunus trituberculatus TaxID=210409 RepID=A0A5B7DGY9_PORTR|nr:hypothetical protein [Portunus trituberculatus]
MKKKLSQPDGLTFPSSPADCLGTTTTLARPSHSHRDSSGNQQGLLLLLLLLLLCIPGKSSVKSS